MGYITSKVAAYGGDRDASFSRMARRHTIQPARNDPDWGARFTSRTCRALTDNVEPLRTRAGGFFPSIEPNIVKAWYFRLLRSKGAPAWPTDATSAQGAREARVGNHEGQAGLKG
jgi:hypothetical protein